jgi:hypothetical protein
MNWTARASRSGRRSGGSSPARMAPRRASAGGLVYVNLLGAPLSVQCSAWRWTVNEGGPEPWAASSWAFAPVTLYVTPIVGRMRAAVSLTGANASRDREEEAEAAEEKGRSVPGSYASSSSDSAHSPAQNGKRAPRGLPLSSQSGNIGPNVGLAQLTSFLRDKNPAVRHIALENLLGHTPEGAADRAIFTNGPKTAAGEPETIRDIKILCRDQLVCVCSCDWQHTL